MQLYTQCRCHASPYPAEQRKALSNNFSVAQIDHINDVQCEERCRRRRRPRRALNEDVFNLNSQNKKTIDQSELCLADDPTIQYIRRNLRNEKRQQNQLQDVMDAYTLHQLRFKCALLEGVSYEHVLAKDAHPCQRYRF